MLQVVDGQWKDHLLAMDHLKEGIGLRGYGQKDPLIEYKREGFEMFEAMENRIARDTVSFLMKVQVAVEAERTARAGDLEPVPVAAPAGGDGQRRSRPFGPAGRLQPAAAPALSGAAKAKIGRNEPCPCGSGKKYKKCCGSQ